jgi:hypothetical protein
MRQAGSAFVPKAAAPAIRRTRQSLVDSSGGHFAGMNGIDQDDRNWPVVTHATNSVERSMNPAQLRTVSGDEARNLLDEQISKHNGGLLSTLAVYDASETVRVWHDTIRAMEEFINVPFFGLDDEALIAWLMAVPLDERFFRNPASVKNVGAALRPHLDGGTVERFCRLMLQIAAIGSGFRLNGQSDFGSGITLDTVGNAMVYLQSRRRHFVSLLYMMPLACKGTARLAPLDALNVMLPQVEHSCVTITSLHLKLMLLDALPEFTLQCDERGALASHWLETLDPWFADPERASIVVMNELRGDEITMPGSEPVDPKKIFSAAELRNSIKLLGASYEAFGLNDSHFQTMAALISGLSHRCRDDYVVAIGKPKLRALLRKQANSDPEEMERLLINRPSTDYAVITNAFEPFVDVGDAVVSNVNLLSRFLYAFKDVHLGSRRRFQIHAGFIFEEMVARELTRLGFDVTDIKRINRKEFDVVATSDGVIYNFQCKNNAIDLSNVETDRDLFVRYNRRLVCYYLRAIAKEERREHLLKSKLGLDAVRHFVISRFPVVTTEDRIVCYNRIGTLASLVGGPDQPRRASR